MWLTVLLSALDEAASAESRRASTHEVARRLGVPWKAEKAAEGDARSTVAVLLDMIEEGVRRARFWGETDPNSRGSGSTRTMVILGKNVSLLLSDGLTSTISFSSETGRPLSIEESIASSSLEFIPFYLPRVATQFEERPDGTYLGWFLRPDYRSGPRLPNHALLRILEPDFYAFADRLREDARQKRIPGDAYWEEATLPWRETSILRVRDWVSATHPRLDGLTWSDCVRLAEAWHVAMRGQRGHDVEYRGPVPDALVVLRWPDGWTAQRLLTKADFAREGIAMGHCVGGFQNGEHPPDGDSDYYKQSRDGKGAIFSLRDPEKVPVATVEVQCQFSLGEGHPVYSHPTFFRIAQAMGPDDGEIGVRRGERDRVVAMLYRLGLFASGKGTPVDQPWKSATVSDQVEEALSLNLGWIPDLLPDEREQALEKSDHERILIPNLRQALATGSAQDRRVLRVNLHAPIFDAFEWGPNFFRGTIFVKVDDLPSGDISETIRGMTVLLFRISIAQGPLTVPGTIGMGLTKAGKLRWFARRSVISGPMKPVPSLLDALILFGPQDRDAEFSAPALLPDRPDVASWKDGRTNPLTAIFDPAARLLPPAKKP